MKEKKILDQLRDKFQKTDEKIDAYFHKADNKLSNVNTFNSFLDPGKTNLIKLKQIKHHVVEGNIMDIKGKSVAGINRNDRSPLTLTHTSKNFVKKSKFEFEKNEMADIKLESNDVIENFMNKAKKKIPYPQGFYDFITIDSLNSYTAKFCLFEKIIFKTIREIQNLNELKYEKFKSESESEMDSQSEYLKRKFDLSLPKFLINQFENLENFNLNLMMSKLNSIEESNKNYSASADPISNNNKGINFFEYIPYYKSDLFQDFFFTRENLIEILKLQEKISQSFVMKSNKETFYSSKADFEYENENTQFKEEKLKFENLDNFVVNVCISSTVIDHQSKSKLPEEIFHDDLNYKHKDNCYSNKSLNFVYDATSTKIYIDDKENLNKLNNKVVNRTGNKYNKKACAFREKLNSFKFEEIPNCLCDKSEKIEKTEKIHTHNSLKINPTPHTNTNSSTVSQNTKLVLDFVLINSQKFVKNFFFKNVLQKMKDEFDKRKINYFTIYPSSTYNYSNNDNLPNTNSDKLFQSIDLIFDNFSACIFLKSEEFEDEFEFSNFQFLYDTINKNYFLYDKIVLFLFSENLENSNDQQHNSNSFRNLENFVRMKFQNLKNFTNFVKIEIKKISLHRISETVVGMLQNMIEENKEEEDFIHLENSEEKFFNLNVDPKNNIKLDVNSSQVKNTF